MADRSDAYNGESEDGRHSQLLVKPPSTGGACSAGQGKGGAEKATMCNRTDGEARTATLNVKASSCVTPVALPPLLCVPNKACLLV